MGLQVGRDETQIPDWALVSLLDKCLKKGKGRHVGWLLFKGAVEHAAMKAGGNEQCQLLVAEKGIVTSSEKHLIAHSALTPPSSFSQQLVTF